MEKILQIGEGNFLRAFADYYIQLGNENGAFNGSVVICQPRSNNKTINALNSQGCKYHINMRGRFDGEVVDSVKEIKCVSRCIDTAADFDKLIDLAKSNELEIVISNTTEAGIAFCENDKFTDAPSVSFPAKVTVLLYERFKATDKGLIFLPVELIENNGNELKRIVLEYARLWNLGSEFSEYVNSKCYFCNTLVDRIVTGKIDFDGDECAVACEPYGSWLIECDDKISEQLALDKISDDIKFVSSLADYRKRKVRILNGAHTMSVLAAYLNGFDIVRDMVNDATYKKYINLGLQEVKCTLDFDEKELDLYIASVLERFNNPYIDHKLLDISLNSVSKWTARCLPILVDYVNINGRLPKILTFSLAALIAFYQHKGSDRQYDVLDTVILDEDINSILKSKASWGVDLTEIDGLEEKVSAYYKLICENGIDYAVKEVINE